MCFTKPPKFTAPKAAPTPAQAPPPPEKYAEDFEDAESSDYRRLNRPHSKFRVDRKK